jgi:hypothetical protein
LHLVATFIAQARRLTWTSRASSTASGTSPTRVGGGHGAVHDLAAGLLPSHAGVWQAEVVCEFHSRRCRSVICFSAPRCGPCISTLADILNGQIELDQGGYVVVREGAKTNVEGVFAAGDLHDTGGAALPGAGAAAAGVAPIRTAAGGPRGSRCAGKAPGSRPLLAGSAMPWQALTTLLASLGRRVAAGHHSGGQRLHGGAQRRALPVSRGPGDHPHAAVAAARKRAGGTLAP